MSIFHHPSEVGMTYLEHMMFSLSLAGKFGSACILAIAHALYPDIFLTSSTDAITAIMNQINNHKAQKK
tara:strand:- start:1751 stop:1957 length:207 start_codon:yes stop_codon:yes gene_type:complete